LTLDDHRRKVVRSRNVKKKLQQLRRLKNQLLPALSRNPDSPLLATELSTKRTIARLPWLMRMKMKTILEKTRRKKNTTLTTSRPLKLLHPLYLLPIHPLPFPPYHSSATLTLNHPPLPWLQSLQSLPLLGISKSHQDPRLSQSIFRMTEETGSEILDRKVVLRVELGVRIR